MSLSLEALAEMRRQLDRAVSFTDLARFDWRRQTDLVQQAFIVARLFTDLGPDALFVDGHINDRVKRRALDDKGGVRGFFNRRFHDCGLRTKRVLFFDTVTTSKMGDRRDHGAGRHRLHFHAVIELPQGWSHAELKRRLAKIFGAAEAMGRRQFHVSEPDWEKHHTHNDIQVAGTLGKMLYVAGHAGATYSNLDLNDGKRSRKAPASRGLCNRAAKGLAKGIPSNFNGAVVFCDHASKRAGKEAFETWVKAEQVQRRSRSQELPLARPLRQRVAP